MKIQGTFKNITNTKTYFVQIGRSGIIKNIKGAEEYDHEDNESIYFAHSPVIISSDLSDTFENVYIRQCSITLTCNYDIRPEIVANNYADLPVIIRYDDENGNIIFSGFVAPLSFNQPYAKEYNEITLECYDKLGTLEYMKFPPLLSSYNYNTPRFFIDLILDELNFTDVDYNELEYDYTESTKINPIIFVGESEDDWKNCKEVLEEIGKVYGCYFYQDGDVCKVRNILLYDLSNSIKITKDNYKANDTNISIQEAYNRIELQVSLSGVDETIIDPFDDKSLEYVGERSERVLSEIVYNLGNKQTWDLFLGFRDTLWNPDGSSWPNRPAAVTLNNNAKDWQQYENNDDNFSEYDYYCRIMKNDGYFFGDSNYLNSGQGSTGQNVYRTLEWLYEHPGKGAFLDFGKTSNLVDTKRREPLDWDSKKMLLIQVGGHGRSHKAGEGDAYIISRGQALQSQFETYDPICSVYIKNANNYIPNDVNKTNYLVISGKMRLNPLQCRTGYWYEYPAPPGGNGSYNTDPFYSWNPDVMSSNTIQKLLYNWNQMEWQWGTSYYEGGAYSGYNGIFSFWQAKVYKNNDDRNAGLYYQHYCWDNIPEGGEIQWPFNQVANFTRRIALPYLTPGTLMGPYNTSSYTTGTGGEATGITKLAVLACELTIGEPGNEKYLIEDLEVLKNANYKQIPYDVYKRIYKWKSLNECPEYNGVKQTWFTIGVYQDKGSYILGDELEVQNTVCPEMDLQSGVKGTAIPITSNDHLQGPMTFKILGPYNARWTTDRVVKHGWQWFDYFGFNTNDRYLMDYVENIQITDFKINAYANGQLKTVGSTKRGGDNDLVYYSHTNDIYTETKQYTSVLCTCLTDNDASELGISFGLTNSSIITLNDDPFYGMDEYDSLEDLNDDNKIKLEEARLSEQYYIWKRPRNIIQSTLELITPEKSYIDTNYRFDYLKYKNTNVNQIYRILAREIDLKLDNMNCMMKEISDAPIP